MNKLLVLLVGTLMSTTVFAAALPAQLTPAYIISKDINDIGLLTELLLKRSQLFVDGLVFKRPFFLVPFLMRQEGCIWLKS